MELKIKKGKLQATIETLGAELCSLRNMDNGQEYIWQADPAWWARHAPVLFPIVGKLRDNTYVHAGRSYSLPQHGLARDQQFSTLYCQENTATFQLIPNAECLAVYPWRFRLTITYNLEPDVLAIGYEVANTDTSTMYFNLGAHPGFRVPFRPNGQFSDYAIHFPDDEVLQVRQLSNGLLTDEVQDLKLTDGMLDLDYELFANDALILQHLRSTSVSLLPKKGKGGLKLNIENWPYLGIWTKVGAPFLCIEPWHGHADTLTASGELSEKPAIQHLEPGQVFSTSYSVELL